MFCPNCGTENDTSAKFCTRCGAPLPDVHQAASASAETRVPESPEPYYKAFIGPRNQDYYLRHFVRFDAKGRPGPSWHWPVFFVTFWWLLYRKMWLHALVYFFLPYVASFVIGFAAGGAGDYAEAVGGLLSLLYLAAVLLLPPIYANALYYMQCKRRIAAARASSAEVEKQLAFLSATGGTSNVALIVIAIIAAVLLIGILAATSIPAYQDYLTRARVSSAVAVGDAAAEKVGRYYEQHQVMPRTLDEAGFETPLPASIGKIDLNPQTGAVIITMAGAPVEGESVLLEPTVEANNQVTWKCVSQDMPEQYLPRQCQARKRLDFRVLAEQSAVRVHGPVNANRASCGRALPYARALSQCFRKFWVLRDASRWYGSGIWCCSSARS